MATNQPHNKRDAGGDKPDRKGSPAKEQPGKSTPGGGSKGQNQKGSGAKR